MGRPAKDFTDSSERSKRRKTEELRKSYPVEELSYATQMLHRSEGNIPAANIVKDVTENPSHAVDIQKVLSQSNFKKVQKHTPAEALALFVEAD